MDKYFKKQSDAIREANLAAMREGNIDSQQLLGELAPLLSDYFVGDFTIEGQQITMYFLNGQRFKLTIEKI